MEYYVNMIGDTLQFASDLFAYICGVGIFIGFCGAVADIWNQHTKHWIRGLRYGKERAFEMFLEEGRAHNRKLFGDSYAVVRDHPNVRL